MACGELALSIDYFYSLTPRQFVNILIGFREKEYRAHKERWEQVRLQLHASLLPYSPKEDFSPKDVLEFPWEEPSRVRVIKSLEEINKIL